MEGIDSQSTPINEKLASKSSSENRRQKTDVVLRHIIEGQDLQDKQILICQWCNVTYRGRGIN